MFPDSFADQAVTCSRMHRSKALPFDVREAVGRAKACREAVWVCVLGECERMNASKLQGSIAGPARFGQPFDGERCGRRREI